MNTLGEEYPKEQARCRELLKQYQLCGSAGAFGYMMISQVLERADQAVILGDLTAMIRSYGEMKDCK